MPRFSPARLRALRADLGLSREALAVRSKRSHSAIEKYEAGAMDPSSSSLYALADALGCQMADLFDQDQPADRYYLTADEVAEVRARVASMPEMTDQQLDEIAAVINGVRAVGSR